MGRAGFALIAAIIVGTAVAVNQAAAETRVITSDLTAQFVPLEVNKFIVIDLPRGAKEVLVANPKIANVMMQTDRRVLILAVATGQTDIVFYDAARQQIEALNLSVVGFPPASANPPAGPEYVVTVISGGGKQIFLSCTHTSDLSEGAACYATPTPPNNSNSLDALPKGSTVTIPVGK